MRILHTADWHLGRRLNRVQRLDEQTDILNSLVEKARELDPDVVVVAGDVFDVFTPGADAEQLYYRTVQRLAEGGQRPVLVVAGNHDSPSKLTAPRALLETQGVFAYGDPHDPDDVPETREHAGFTVEDAGPGWLDLTVDGERGLFHLLPFPSKARLPSHVDHADASATEVLQQLAGEVPDADRRYLVSHLYVGSGHDVDQDHDDYVGGAYAVDPAVLEGYDAAFLGHLHQPFGPAGWRYAGSPMAFDFDDPDVDRGGWLHEDGEWTPIELDGARGLAERHVGSLEAALEWAATDPDAWTRLVFERGTVIERQGRQRLREAFGERLVDIRFEAPDEEASPSQQTVDLGESDPETAFRRYVEETDGAEPDEALVDLFLDVLDPEETDPDDEDGDQARAEQARLEVDP